MTAELPPTSIVASIAQSIQRDLNIAADPSADRLTKRKALEKVCRETVDKLPSVSAKADSTAVLDGHSAQELFQILCRPLALLFADATEKVREIAVNCCMQFCIHLTDIRPSLPVLVPAIVNRLATKDIVEPSEEIRLQLVQLLQKVTTLSGKHIELIVDDIIAVISKTLLDPYADVRKQSCSVVVQLSKDTPHKVRLHVEPLCRIIVMSLQHRHSAVRITAIQALEAVMMADSSGFNETWPSIYKLLQDSAGLVRDHLYGMAGRWQLELPDRYSFAPKLLLVILAGIKDDLPNLAERNKNVMETVGALYEKEWPDRVKDYLNYDYKNAVERPRVGCRKIVQDNLLKITDQVVNDLGDWSAQVRKAAAAICTSLGVYSEEMITGYINKLLPCFYKICRDDDIVATNEILQACRAIGSFVVPQVYLGLAIPQLNNATTFTSVAILRVINNLFSSTNTQHLAKADFSILLIYLEDKNNLAHDDVDLLYQRAVLLNTVLDKLLHVEETLAHELSYFLFVCWCRLLAICLPLNNALQHVQHGDSTLITTQMKRALAIFKESPYFLGDLNTAKQHCNVLLTSCLPSPESQSIDSRMLPLLAALLMLPDTCKYVNMSQLETLLIYVGTIKGDSKTKLGAIQLMQQAVMISADLTTHPKLDISQLIDNLLLPTLTWQTGAPAAIIRQTSMSCLALCFGIESQSTSPISLSHISNVNSEATTKNFIAAVLNVMDEDNAQTRVHALAITRVLLQSKLLFDGGIYARVYPSVLKRLDDSNDDIRVLAAHTICALVRSLPDSFDDVHYQEIIKAIMIHLDDTYVPLQEAVLECLLQLRQKSSTVPNAYIDAHKAGYRSQHLIQRLIAQRLY